MLFRELAKVVADLGEETGLRSFQLPYPAAAQLALDRAVLRCLDLGIAAPKSLPELLQWCRYKPADDPFFAVPDTLVLPDTRLVHGEGLLPSRSCAELASAGTDDGPEETARRLLAELAGRCGPIERFHRSRQFLALNPVIRRDDPFGPDWSREIWSRVKDFYRPVPESLTAGGTLLCCGSCRLPALLDGGRVPDRGAPVSGPSTWCEGENCPHGTPMELIRKPGDVLLLRKPLRIYLSLPFRLELAVLGELDRAGISHRALTGELAGYQLRDDDLAVRQVYIRDRVQPSLLAERFTGDMEPALVVVPEALAGSVGYRTAFNQMTSSSDRIQLTGPADLVARLCEDRAPDRSATQGEQVA
ncbi:pPIWI_RE_Y domain-containing protein [Streptomyces sp. NPDC004031]